MFDRFLKDQDWKWDDGGATELLHNLVFGQVTHKESAEAVEGGDKAVYEASAADILNHFNCFVSMLLFRTRHTLFLTQAGRFGISLGTAKPGDAIVIADALDQPLIFRSVEKSGTDTAMWALVGDGSVLRLMAELDGLHPSMEVFKIV